MCVSGIFQSNISKVSSRGSLGQTPLHLRRGWLVTKVSLVGSHPCQCDQLWVAGSLSEFERVLLVGVQHTHCLLPLLGDSTHPWHHTEKGEAEIPACVCMCMYVGAHTQTHTHTCIITGTYAKAAGCCQWLSWRWGVSLDLGARHLGYLSSICLICLSPLSQHWPKTLYLGLERWLNG